MKLSFANVVVDIANRLLMRMERVQVQESPLLQMAALEPCSKAVLSDGSCYLDMTNEVRFSDLEETAGWVCP